jgi:hypothetical protein
MIYGDSGSSSYLGKVLYLVPAPVTVLIPVPVPVPDPDLLSTVFNNRKFVQNLAFTMLEAALFPRKLVSIFLFCSVLVHFMLDPGLNPVPEPKLDQEPKLEYITVPVLVALRQKCRFLWLRFRSHNTACEMLASWL